MIQSEFSYLVEAQPSTANCISRRFAVQKDFRRCSDRSGTFYLQCIVARDPSAHAGRMITKTFNSATRQQQNLLAPLEKKTLIWLARRTPQWINSDHLTLLGFLGMALAGGCYFYARWNPMGLFGAVIFLTVNWFGDSLDGTLARVRNRQRPRYGFYVDHIVDAFGAIFLIGGMGLSGYMTGTIALILIVAYFLLAIEIYLATYTVGVFRLSFGIWGPTELRIVLAFGTLVLSRMPRVDIGSGKYLLCDVGGVVAIVALVGFTIHSAVQNTVRLYREEPLA
jgi:archaetidylinositol phosphate synthase